MLSLYLFIIPRYRKIDWTSFVKQTKALQNVQMFILLNAMNRTVNNKSGSILKGLAQAKIIKKSVILFRVLNI